MTYSRSPAPMSSPLSASVRLLPCLPIRPGVRDAGGGRQQRRRRTRSVTLQCSVPVASWSADRNREGREQALRAPRLPRRRDLAQGPFPGGVGATGRPTHASSSQELAPVGQEKRAVATRRRGWRGGWRGCSTLIKSVVVLVGASVSAFKPCWFQKVLIEMGKIKPRLPER